MSSLPSQRRWILTASGILWSLSLLSGCVAWWLIAVPVLTLSNVEQHATHFPYVLLHALTGSVMLFIGALNIYLGATRQYARLHRPLGLAYVFGGSIGALSAIALALGNGHGDPVTEFVVDPMASNDHGWALATLGLAWLVATAMGYRAALNRRFSSHQTWMIRSYVLVWSFVLCRLIGRVPSFPEFGSGATIIWLSWILPLLICEVALQWQSGRRQ